MLISLMKEEEIPQVAALEQVCFSEPWTEQGLRESFAKPEYLFVPFLNIPADALLQSLSYLLPDSEGPVHQLHRRAVYSHGLVRNKILFHNHVACPSSHCTIYP